jgi:hypothetical protein
MKDAIELRKAERQPNGRREAYGPCPAGIFFEPEEAAAGRLWITLRALRVLKWWEKRRPSNKGKTPAV